MSNFICSECGMTNIDCGGAGYKTPKEIELGKKLDIAVKALEELETKSDKFDNSWSMQEQLDFIKAKCQETLYQLKEIEDVK